MRIPELVICADALPAAECLAIFPGAAVGSPAVPAYELLQAEGIAPGEGEPVRELKTVQFAGGHLLAAAVRSLRSDDPDGMELYKARLADAIAFADKLGAREFGLLCVPTEVYNSRLFAVNTVTLRVLMQERESHPCLERIRFFCRSREDAEWIARVYNFFYPESKADRMLLPE